MKKNISVLIVMCILLVTIVSCAQNNGGDVTEISTVIENTLDEKNGEQYKCGKSVYDSLVSAEKTCVQIADGVYTTWHFAIYTINEYSGSTLTKTICRDFSNKVGIPLNKLITAMDKFYGYSGGNSDENLLFMHMLDFNEIIDIVLQAYKDEGIIDDLDKDIATAKNKLKTMTEKYSDYSEYSMLKTYYSKVNSYSDFVKSPTGSFEQLQTTIETYEREMRDCRGNLEFVFVD